MAFGYCRWASSWSESSCLHQALLVPVALPFSSQQPLQAPEWSGPSTTKLLVQGSRCVNALQLHPCSLTPLCATDCGTLCGQT